MSVFKNFIKYHSLGNDFVIFDGYKKPANYIYSELNDARWKSSVTALCDRHYGVGADGVLIITHAPQDGMPQMLIFNADGTQSENCLNGLRCVAHYLHTAHNFPAQFSIGVGQREVACSIDPSGEIITTVGGSVYVGTQSITVDGKDVSGHIVTVGNPHFVIFDSVELSWLRQHGAVIESNKVFPNKTNVEFVWPDNKADGDAYTALIYERGCGITLACSSGVAAIVGLLAHQGLLLVDKKLTIQMLGGNVVAWIDQAGSIVLQAKAHLIYKGAFDQH